jgi:fructokinase
MVETCADIITLGELMVDFMSTAPGSLLEDSPGFERATGGAPANVAVGLARLGIRAGFVGKVGADAFGRYLRSTLVSNGVDVSWLGMTESAPTGLAFVALSRAGEREFLFYRQQAADTKLDPIDVDEGYISSARVLHHGSISLIHEPSRSATLKAVKVASREGLMVSYDPNVRLSLWPDADSAHRGILLGAAGADIVKLSEPELFFLTERFIPDEDPALSEAEVFSRVRTLLAFAPRARCILITAGARGCYYAIRRDCCSEATPRGEATHAIQQGLVGAFKVNAVDTTGAGDAFSAGFLYALLQDSARDICCDREAITRALLDEQRLVRSITFANAVAGLSTLGRGAIDPLPTLDHVLAFLAKRA